MIACLSMDDSYNFRLRFEQPNLTTVSTHSIVLRWGQMTSYFLAATKHLYEWSVRTSFPLCPQHHIIMEFFRSYYHWQKWCPCKRPRSKVKVTDVKFQQRSFRAVTPVWIHIWQWNGVQSLMWHKRGALLFFKVIRQISRSHGTKKCRFWPECGVSGL